MAQQGYCPACKVRIEWSGELSLPKARCPQCRGRLKRTSHQNKKPVYRAKVRELV